MFKLHHPPGWEKWFPGGGLFPPFAPPGRPCCPEHRPERRPEHRPGQHPPRPYEKY